MLNRVGGLLHGRVKSKTPIKVWHKDSAEGKLFSFIICDESGEINVIASDDLCDSLFAMIEVGRCYQVGRFSVRAANSQFKKTDHACEVQLTKVIEIFRCHSKF